MRGEPESKLASYGCETGKHRAGGELKNTSGMYGEVQPSSSKFCACLRVMAIVVTRPGRSRQGRKRQGHDVLTFACVDCSDHGDNVHVEDISR